MARQGTLTLILQNKGERSLSQVKEHYQENYFNCNNLPLISAASNHFLQEWKGVFLSSRKSRELIGHLKNMRNYLESLLGITSYLVWRSWARSIGLRAGEVGRGVG